MKGGDARQITWDPDTRTLTFLLNPRARASMANQSWEGWTHGWRTWTRGQTRRDPARMEICLRLPTNQAERILGLFWTVWTPCVSQKHLEEPKNALKYATGRKERQTDQRVTGDDTKIDPKVA